MIEGTLDTSWRRRNAAAPPGPPIPIVVLFPDADAPKLSEIEAIGFPPESMPHLSGQRACITWQLGTSGLLWLGNSYTLCHGDERFGKLACPAVGQDYLERHSPLAWGHIGFERTRLRVTARTWWKSKWATGPRTNEAIAQRFVAEHTCFMAMLAQAADVVWTYDLSGWEKR